MDEPRYNDVTNVITLLTNQEKSKNLLNIPITNTSKLPILPTGSSNGTIGTSSSGPPKSTTGHTASNEKPYSCTHCGRGYSYLASLQQHLKTHQIEYQFQCKSCSKLFKNKEELEVHMKSHSDGTLARPHQCETCGKRFTLLENLHRHQMIHSDQRPFHCNHCGKSFRLAQHLRGFV